MKEAVCDDEIMLSTFGEEKYSFGIHGPNAFFSYGANSKVTFLANPGTGVSPKIYLCLPLER